MLRSFSLKSIDTRSAFFGFIIGFCLYLFISHVILDSFFGDNTDTSPIFTNNNIQKSSSSSFGGGGISSQITNWVVPWVYYKDIESLANSVKFPSEINKPPDVVDKSESDLLRIKREKQQFYGGGDIDEKHLGGWKYNDSDTYERELWDWIIDRFNITSVMDIGCGIGCSTIYFKNHPNINDALCVEGSIDAINNSLVKDISVHHDYTRGPYWPNKVYDMVWSAEFLEHVGQQYMENYMATFKSAKILFVTHSAWGGWHHVNVHESEWWIYKFESFGFSYQDKITELAREQCPLLGEEFKYSYHDLHTDGNRKNSHFHFHGLVFFNKLFMNRLTEYDQKILKLLAQ